MITHESLREQAARLPKALRVKYFNERLAIHRRIHERRRRQRLQSRDPLEYVPVPWDDPEFVALCAIKLAELMSEVQDAANRLASR